MSHATVAPAPAVAPPPARAVSSLQARLGAEVLGTFVLTFAIIGTALYNKLSNAGLTLAVAFAGGLALVAAVAALGHVSGGHFNPAVTLGLTIIGRASWKDLLPYWVAQVVGGLLAAGALFLTLPKGITAFFQQAGVIAADKKSSFFELANTGYGTHSPIATASQGAAQTQLFVAFLIEVIVTALLVAVIIGVTDPRSKVTFAPVAIGLALFVGILVAGPLTNASLNPARSTASAIFAHQPGQLWLFWVAPLLGGAIAALFYLAFATPKPETVELSDAELADLADAEDAATITAADGADVVTDLPAPPAVPGETAPEKPADDSK